ncbi:DUF6438 domain-containing protein [Virgibacillus byunsanensis]|uniref:DUF6438 domain-containing protein n=1 Tax=Virgibacillus byunsanensis TaxID=570945 RepID=A0ABW3LS79_9BACI
MFKKLYVERTACYGTCPIYRIELLADGTVHWNGDMHVSYLGETSFAISESKMQKITALLQSFDYRNFNYKPGDLFATDHPACLIRVEFEDGYIKEIDHDLGEQESYINDSTHSLKNLEKFEQKLEQLIGVRPYVKQTLSIYHIISGSVECVVSAPNKKEALKLVRNKSYEGERQVHKIGKDTTDTLFPYVVMEASNMQELYRTIHEIADSIEIVNPYSREAVKIDHFSWNESIEDFRLSFRISNNYYIFHMNSRRAGKNLTQQDVLEQLEKELNYLKRSYKRGISSKEYLPFTKRVK